MQATDKISYLDNYIGHKRTKIRLVLEGVASGVAASLVAVLYRLVIEKADELRNHFIALMRGDYRLIFLWVFILALGGLIIGWVIKYEPMSSGSGIPQVKGMILGLIDASWIKIILAKFVGGVVAIFGGLSLGREGPSIQLGSAAATGVGRLFKRSKGEERFVLTCGASSGLATAFNAPFAGLIFSLEEMHKTFSPIVLVSALSSCVVADFISKQVFGMLPVLNFTGIDVLPLSYYPYIIVLGIIMGFVGLLFNKSIVKAQKMINHKRIPKLLVPVIVMVFIGTVGIAFPDALGGGHNLIMELTVTRTLGFLLILLAVKFLFTIISYGSNAPGGIFLPLLAIGALVGSIYGNLLLDFTFVPEKYVINFVILAMAGAFTAIVKAPVTGIVLILEMTASFKTLLPLLTVCLIAFLTAELLGFEPIYDTLLHGLLKRTKAADIPKGAKKEIFEFTVNAGSDMDGKKLKEIVLPADVLIINITRGDRSLTPNGNFRFHVGDIVAVICDRSCVRSARDAIGKITS